MDSYNLQFDVRYIKVVIVTVVIVGCLQLAYSWTGPVFAPPGGSVTGVLTTGVGNQSKLSGDISIAGGGSLFVGGIVGGNSMIAGTDVISPSITATNEICLSGDCVTKWPWK